MQNVIWLLNTSGVTARTLDESAARLSADSRTAAAALARPPIRRRFVLSRQMLRTAVATTAGCDSELVTVSECSGRAPTVTVSPAQILFVSLSHSGTWIACVVGTEPVGVDIEFVEKKRDLLALSALFFSAAEHAWLTRQTDSNLSFYRLWTGKESVFKVAHGVGGQGAVLDVQFEVLDDSLIAPSPAGSLRFLQPVPSLMCSFASRSQDLRAMSSSAIRYLDDESLCRQRVEPLTASGDKRGATD